MTRAPLQSRIAPETRERTRAILRDAARLPECFAALFARWAESARAYVGSLVCLWRWGSRGGAAACAAAFAWEAGVPRGAPGARGKACCKLNKAPPAGRA